MILKPKEMVYDGFSFAPYLDANPRRPLAPPISAQGQAVPGMPGERFQSVKLDPLDIPIDVRLNLSANDDISKIRRIIAAKLFVGKEAALFLPDDPTRYNIGVFTGTSELTNLWHTGATTLNFRASDPIAYGETRRETLGESGGVQVNGTYMTAPKIIVSGVTGENPTLTHIESGATITFELTCDGAQTFVIDCEAQHCTVNGANADKYLFVTSDYPVLAPGMNHLEASSGIASVEWTERWL